MEINFHALTYVFGYCESIRSNFETLINSVFRFTNNAKEVPSGFKLHYQTLLTLFNINFLT